MISSSERSPPSAEGDETSPAAGGSATVRSAAGGALSTGDSPELGPGTRPHPSQPAKITRSPIATNFQGLSGNRFAAPASSPGLRAPHRQERMPAGSIAPQLGHVQRFDISTLPESVHNGLERDAITHDRQDSTACGGVRGGRSTHPSPRRGSRPRRASSQSQPGRESHFGK